MKRKLEELTKDEINTFFPVVLVDYNPVWKVLYEKEQQLIQASIGTKAILRIEHFGSSSIPGIKAKPYIDILIEIPNELLFDEDLIKRFTSLGYSYFKVPQRDNIDAYMSFGKGYNTEDSSEQIFHIHMCPKDNLMWNQISFRDYLRGNLERANEYEALKVQLALKFRNDRGAYVLGKTSFINETLQLIAKASA